MWSNLSNSQQNHLALSLLLWVEHERVHGLFLVVGAKFEDWRRATLFEIIKQNVTTLRADSKNQRSDRRPLGCVEVPQPRLDNIERLILKRTTSQQFSKATPVTIS